MPNVSAAIALRRFAPASTARPNLSETTRESSGTRSAGTTSGGSTQSVIASAMPTPTDEKNAICRKPGKEVRPSPAKLATVVSPPSASEGVIRRSKGAGSWRCGEKHR